MGDPRLTAEDELLLRQQYGLLDFEEPIPDVLLDLGDRDAALQRGREDDNDG